MKTKLVLFSICIAILSMGATAKIKDGKAMTGNSLTEFGKLYYSKFKCANGVRKRGFRYLRINIRKYECTGTNWCFCVKTKRIAKTFIVRTDEFENSVCMPKQCVLE